MRALAFLIGCLLWGLAPATTVTKPTTITINAASGACPVTVGTLTLNAKVSRSSGISPLLVFVDATATTDSATLGGANNPFQDIYYTINYGDSGVSGTGTWAYGSNPGANSRNTATGAIGAHLYVIPDGQGNTNFTPTITAFDGTSTASCTLGVTAYDPSASNGFPTTATTCVSTSGNFTSCPPSANNVTLGTIATINGNLSNKRVLYRCGETFSGQANITGTKWSVGAYGGCENSKINLPIFSDNTAGNHIHIAQSGGQPGATDGRIADIAFRSTGGNAAVAGDFGNAFWMKEITIYNITAAQPTLAYWGAAVETGVIDSLMSVNGNGISFFINTNENNCLNGSLVFQCGQGAGAQYVPVNYNAALGNFVLGCPGCNTAETMRQSAGRMTVISNNTLNGAGGSVSNLKFQDGNTNSQAVWLGQYNEYFEISDNFTGPSGGAGIEVAPQNNGLDERLRYGVVERNLMVGTSNAGGFTLCWISGQNISLRDSMFRMDSTATLEPQAGCQINTRGNNNFPAFLTNAIEAYNNVGIILGTPNGNQVGLITCKGSASTIPANSIFKNTLFQSPQTLPAIATNCAGSGNTISSNTTNSTLSAGFVNASGNFVLTTDWKPTANYSGGTSVPNFYDALGVPWSPTWDLGAVHH